MTENVTSEIKQDVKTRVKAEIEEKSKDPDWLASVAPQLPDWVKKIRLSGDMRLRYEGDFYPSGNGALRPGPEQPGECP